MPDDRPAKKVDEEWKKRAKEEAAKAEAGRAPGEAAGDKAPEQDRQPLYLEASFPMLVNSFATEALIALGAVENPYTGKRERSPEHAKYAIDMLQLIADKTEGNLSADEKRLLDNTLFDLRMRFLGP